MFEAPGDDPEVAPDATQSEEPAEVADEPAADDNMNDGVDDTPPDSGPPDITDDSFDDTGFDSDISEDDGAPEMKFGDKVSSILNAGLYQNYLELVSNISSQLSTIKTNSDILYAITDDMEIIIESLRKLEENIRIYIDTFYINKRYEENLLFYNKCKNLNRLINDKFDQAIHKGIKEA